MSFSAQNARTSNTLHTCSSIFFLNHMFSLVSLVAAVYSDLGIDSRIIVNCKSIALCLNFLLSDGMMESSEQLLLL